MSLAVTTGLACLACGSARTRPFLSGTADRGRDIQRGFVYYRCGECRLRFQITSDEEARALYADVQDVAPRIGVPARRELRCEADVLRAVEPLLPGRRILDVGSGDGFFLAAARAAGFDCLGTDVSARLAETARRRSGADVLVGELSELRLPTESFDLVNLDAVLMYVAAPRELLREIARLLRPGGLCRIREFDPDALAARLKGQRYWMYAPTHVSVWTARSVRALATAAELEFFRVVSGTEASLANWRAAGRGRGVLRALRELVRFWARRASFLGWRLGAETVYYLRKPSAV